VTVLEPERFGERVEKEGLARAAAADEQERIFGNERREDRRLVAIEAVDAELGESGAGFTGLAGGNGRGGCADA